MSIISQNVTLKNVTLQDFQMPAWDFSFLPANSVTYIEGGFVVIQQLNDMGAIGIPAIQQSTDPTKLVYLEDGVFGGDSGARLETRTVLRSFACSSLSSYNFLHDGSGATVFIALKPDLVDSGNLIGTTLGNAFSENGFMIVVDDDPLELRVFVNNGNGSTNIIAINQALTTLAGDVLVIAVTISATGVSLWVNGVFKIFQAFLGTPSTSNASRNLHIFGADGAVGIQGVGYVARGINTVLSDGFIAQYSDYLYTNRG